MKNIEIPEVVANEMFYERDTRGKFIRQNQLKAYFSFLPASVFGNIINALIILVLFYTSVSPIWRGVAMTLAFSMAAIRLVGWLSYRKHGIPAAREAQAFRMINLQALGNGVVWGFSLFGLAIINDASKIGVLGMIAAGMMCAGAISFSAIPSAARLFVAAISTFMLTAFLWSGGPMSYGLSALLASYTFVLMKAVKLAFSNFATRIIREQELTASAETVSLLLNDFESHGSDWLWEIDEQGILLNASARFAEAAERPTQILNGTVLIELFHICPEAEILNSHLKSARAFRDITVPLTIGGELRWWSLSGHPFENSQGAMRLRGVATDISATKNAEVKVAYMAHYDGLTDLPNRFLFNDSLHRALHRQKAGTNIAVMSLDLDHFKGVNDTLGHPAGDALLKIVSRRIESCLKERDIVARMGGDEFAILMPAVKECAAIERVANRILKAVNQPIDIDGNQVLTAASIGIVIAPDNGQCAETLMKHVDLALYSAKADGRNRFSFFEPEMDEAAKARRMVEIDLRVAMNQDQLALHYQPLINVATGETVGYEALVRWHHPERGLVMPNDFVHIAEETGMIVQLGEWVIRNAVAAATQWPEHLGVSINLSPLQMKSGSLISTIVNALASAQIAPHRVEFEITETVLMHETEVNLATLHRLKDIGVRIALDDFGTGYSSLNYLRCFPFDKIKIDKCFIEDVDSREDSRSIIRAVTGLASSLGMITTAEGVETVEQLDRLRTEGCTQVQGYLFSKAIPADELTNLRTSYEKQPSSVSRPEKFMFLQPTEVAMTAEPRAKRQARKRA